MVATRYAGAVHHVLRSAVGARDGGEFSIAPVAVHGKYLAGRNPDMLREGSVEVGPEPNCVHPVETRPAHARTDKYPIANPAAVAAWPHRDNARATIGALDEGKCRLSVPAAILTIGIDGCGVGAVLHGPGIPAESGVDVGIVDPRGEHGKQDLARTRHGDRDLPVFEPIVSTGAGRHDSHHGALSDGRRAPREFVLHPSPPDVSAQGP